ncbi:hypothetical protein FA13DRAFT_1712492 [Coprinellus micaceus]|uniref:Uncharacterized protein n=1 Tax=Coprinellus micaceus TaxID=71717 RepID=A0A4Y7T236_COPMI|nr:hypothetical protein FA13DRAFT_1712492 [Coprinellus micaceus]
MGKDSPNSMQVPAWPSTARRKQMHKSREKYRSKKVQDKESQAPAVTIQASGMDVPAASEIGGIDDGLPEKGLDGDAASKGSSGLTIMPLDRFINALANLSSDEIKINALINISPLKSSMEQGKKVLLNVRSSRWSHMTERGGYPLTDVAPIAYKHIGGCLLTIRAQSVSVGQPHRLVTKLVDLHSVHTLERGAQIPRIEVLREEILGLKTPRKEQTSGMKRGGGIALKPSNEYFQREG